MRTATLCPGCGSEVTTSEPDPLNTNPSAGIVKTFEKDLDGEDVARCWHVECRQRDLKRRGADSPPEPSTVDWEMAIRDVLKEAEEAA